MGKGSCKKTRVIKEREPIELEDRVSNLSVRAPVRDKKEDQNINLLKYQQHIANDPQNKSVTKQVLTKEMATEMHHLRTRTGDGLGNCVYVNYKNPNAKFPYAVSADCYSVFADFFAEVVERTHGDPQTEAILSPQFGNLNSNSHIDLNSCDRARSRVIYTEICVRRNLQDIPFTSSMESNDRKNVISQIESKIRNIFEDSIEEAVVPEIWDKRLDTIKNDLDEVGTMRDYPDDRMTLVFKDDVNIYQGCVLNFDDHIQYIISTNDGRIGEVYRRMYDLLTNESMAGINYFAHPFFGHLTLSPEHVGTGMNIRVLAKFPYASRLADVNSQIKEFDCTTTEDYEQDSQGFLILSNIKTLNTTEEEIYRNVILSFNKLSRLEDELEKTTAMAVQDDSMSAEDLENLFNIITESSYKSYTKKYLTSAVVLKYKLEKTNFGSTLNNCIRHNAYFPRSVYPRACDANCYLKFSRFFDPILLELNGINIFNHAKRPTYGSTVADQRYRLHHPNIKSYRVRFSRNFEAFPFPMMMSSKDRADVERIMIRGFDELPVELEGDYCPIKLIRESIHYEHISKLRLIPSSNEVDISSGFYRNWPKNRGMFIAKKSRTYPNITLIVLINFADHIKVIALDPTGRALNLCYERAVSMMKLLDLKFENKYAKKPGYGYLTSTPCFVGCAMRVSAHVKLVNLGDKREVMENECKGLQLVYRGFNGHGTVPEGHVFDISLRKNMNETEQYIMIMFVQRLRDIIDIERTYDSKIPKPSYGEDSEESYNDGDND